MKHLLYITNARIPTEKAHGVQIMKSCEAFARTGARVTLIVPRRVNALKENPFRYYGVKPVFSIRKISSPDFFRIPFFPRSAAFFLHAVIFALAAVTQLFFRHSKDAIYYSRDYVTLFFLCLFGFHPIAEIHDYRASRPKRAIGFIAARAKKIVVNSEGTFAALNAHYALARGKCAVVSNGVDPLFFAVKESRDEARMKLGMPKDAFIIGYVGGLETIGREKGVATLLEAFHVLSHAAKRYIVYVVGGPASRAQQYKKRATELGIPPHQAVFTGHIPYTDIPLYLKAMDAVVIPLPATEHALTTSPIKLFEFFAAGKVIIASDLPALRAHLNEKNALFFEPENARDLAQKMQFIAEHPEEKDRLSRQAALDATNHTWDSRAKNIIDFIA